MNFFKSLYKPFGALTVMALSLGTSLPVLAHSYHGHHHYSNSNAFVCTHDTGLRGKLNIRTGRGTEHHDFYAASKGEHLRIIDYNVGWEDGHYWSKVYIPAVDRDGYAAKTYLCFH